MRTTINVDDAIFKEIIDLTGAYTKTRAVNEALVEYVRLKKKQRLIDLSGKIHVEENWRELRRMEEDEIE